MKRILLIILLCNTISLVQSQNIDNNTDINSLKQIINGYDATDFMNRFGITQAVFIGLIDSTQGIGWLTKSMLLKLIASNDKFNEYLPVLTLRHIINHEILELKFCQCSDDYIVRIADLEKLREIVDDHMNRLVDINYAQYAYQDGSIKGFKSFHAYHDNDVFLFSKTNKDRDYTGGFRFEWMTDRLKMRLIKNAGNTDYILSYQSFFFGGEGYTPYIRFNENELRERNVLYEIDKNKLYFTQASLDTIQSYMRANQRRSDRPFASFQYVGRGKYRLHNSGRWKLESLFKVGIVGGNIGKVVQAVIHQDLTHGSQRVLNWEDQIAYGGRLAINIEHKYSLSLFSLYSRLTKKHPARTDNFYNKLIFNTNLYLPAEVAIGTVQTHIGTGLGISNKSFRDADGVNSPKLVRYRGINTRLGLIWKNSFVNVEYNFRYVIHNSMLEGIGIFNTFEDDPKDDETITVYKLNKEDVERRLHKLSWTVGYRVNKIAIYYRQERLINKEFNVKDVNPIYPEFATQNWYGYGRIGLNFFL